MESVLHVLGIAVLLGICLAAVLSIVVGLPGTLVMLVVAVLYAWATDFAALSRHGHKYSDVFSPSVTGGTLHTGCVGWWRCQENART